MNSTLKPLVESAIRYALAVCVGYFGITVAQEEANTFVAVALLGSSVLTTCL